MSLPRLPVTTERLVLRRCEERDVDDLHAIYGRDDVAAYLLHDALTREQTRARFLGAADPGDSPAHRPGEDGLGLVVELAGGVVGRVSLGSLPPPGRARLDLPPGRRGQRARHGGGASDGRPRVRPLRAPPHQGRALDGRNEASRRLCERLGLRQEGHRLQDFWSKGEWTDTYEYAVLASEWDGRRH